MHKSNCRSSYDSLFDLRTGYWNGDLLAIFDTVAAGVVQELDFRNEAANGMEFKKSLGFLGYVDVPDTLPELTTRRAMAMEWVRRRRRLSDPACGRRTQSAHRLASRVDLLRPRGSGEKITKAPTFRLPMLLQATAEGCVDRAGGA